MASEHCHFDDFECSCSGLDLDLGMGMDYLESVTQGMVLTRKGMDTRVKAVAVLLSYAETLFESAPAPTKPLCDSNGEDAWRSRRVSEAARRPRTS